MDLSKLEISDVERLTSNRPDEPTPAVPKWLGKRVGRFKLQALLGKGTMGRVFRAQDTLLQRQVALKILPKQFRVRSKSINAAELVQEARSVATLEHPNIVRVYEAGEDRGVHFIAMELLEGGTLQELVQATGPLDVSRACSLIADAADALGYAHDMGIVHRDVKPANLMLTRSGRCKVVDFGLARVENASETFVPLGEGVGTPQFIAPEIIRGKRASAQSDIYGLGGVLFTLLAGRIPFETEVKKVVLEMHLNSPIPDLAQFRDDLPPSLVDCIRKAMSKLPEERFESAAHLARALRLHTSSTASGSGSTGIESISEVSARDSTIFSPADGSGQVSASGSSLASTLFPDEMESSGSMPASQPRDGSGRGLLSPLDTFEVIPRLAAPLKPAGPATTLRTLDESVSADAVGPAQSHSNQTHAVASTPAARQALRMSTILMIAAAGMLLGIVLTLLVIMILRPRSLFGSAQDATLFRNEQNRRMM